jgi:hypothetical protein
MDFLTITNTPRRQGNAFRLLTLCQRGQLAQKPFLQLLFIQKYHKFHKNVKRLREIVNCD